MKAYEILASPANWKQFSYNDGRDPTAPGEFCGCAAGAIRRKHGATSKLWDIHTRAEALAVADFAKLARHLGIPRNPWESTDEANITRWNDKRERKYEEVVGALRACDI